MPEFIITNDLIKSEASEKEAHLSIAANNDLSTKAQEILTVHYQAIENYARAFPEFAKSYSPRAVNRDAPLIIKEMAKAAKQVRVGPMAAVAGAIAQFVGQELLKETKELIIENGADIFLMISQPRKLRLNQRLALELEPQKESFGVSILPGPKHAFSFGKADTVVVIAKNSILSDAVVTAIGNEIKDSSDIDRGLNLAKKIKGLSGVLIKKGERTGLLGKIKLTSG